MAVKVSKGKLNFRDDAMVANVEKFNTRHTGTMSSVDDYCGGVRQ
jgi:hypothetical protein